MRVAIIIPTQDKRPEMLEEAMESIAGQTMSPTSVIVARGAGSLADRLNAAVTMADCDAFVVLADDDKLDPMFLQKTSDVMTRENVDIVYTDCHIFGANNSLGGALGIWTKENIDRNTVPLCTSLCRKSAWEKAGGYADVPFYDWDFWWRCFYTGASAYWLKQPLFWWRDHGTSSTADMEKYRQFILNRHDEIRSVMV